MPRDSSGTKARLVREAERLFARRGVYQVTVREITEAAGQRNVSALSYHFGSREGVLRAILVRHGDPIDEERGALLASLEGDSSTRELLGTLLVPMARRLSTADGRDYLRIVAQLTARFAVWREPGELSPPNLRRILGLLEARPAGLSAAVRRERVLGVIMLMMAAFAERARALESPRRGRLALDEDAFLSNLADMLGGVLEAAETTATVEGQLERPDGAGEVVELDVGLGDRPQVRPVASELAEQQLELVAGQVGPDAEVGGVTERQVVVR